MSQVTDGAKIQHTEAFMRILARKRKTNWKSLEGDFKTVLKNYDIGQKDWDVIRKYGLVEFKGNDVISPKVLERMTDTDIKSVFNVSNTGDILRARDGIVAKLNNFLFDLKDTSSLTPNLKTRARMTGKQKQGTVGSFGVNIGTQYMSSPLAFKQRVLGYEFAPVRGEKFDKLNAIKKGGVLLAVAVISGFTVLNTKEAIVNIQRKALGLKPHDRYNLFDKHGELDPEVVLKSLITGGGLGIWGDLFTKVAQNADNISDSLNVVPAVGTVEPIITLMNKLATGDTKNIDRDVNKVIKGITPSTLYSKEATNSAVVWGLDLLFKNNLKGNIERNRRRYAKR
jgi:hypothetical protein